MLNSGIELQNRYRIEKRIGEGGMGTVYIATDLRFGTKVAIKETHFDDANMRRAFEHEAQLLNGLRHSALPRVSDHFCEEDGQFIVMEYIAGKDLSNVIQGGFPLEDVLRWADTLLDALDYLHTQKVPIIHRDIKPQNLKLTGRGEIILLDFGLAKGSIAEQTQASTAKSVYGYSHFYAPLEQIQGVGTDQRTDIFSFAATMYHLLTGQLPIDCITRATAVVKGEQDPLPSAHDSNKKVPVSISNVLQKALELNPHLRQATAAQVRRELVEAASQSKGQNYIGLHDPADDKTLADNYSSVKNDANKFVVNNLAQSSKTDGGYNHPVQTLKPGGKNYNQTDQRTEYRKSGKPYATQATVQRDRLMRENRESGFLSQIQTSRTIQSAMLVLVLLIGGVSGAWYALTPSQISSNQIEQDIKKSKQNFDSDSSSIDMTNSQPDFNESENTNTVYTSTQTNFQPESSSGVKTVQNSPIVETETQSREASSQPESAQILEASNTPEPPKPEQSVSRENSGSQFDEEKLKTEMKKQVDEAIRQREESMRRQANEQAPQEIQIQRLPPPDGRRYPPPPPGHRPPPHRRP